jgi:hypothetical protein
MTRRNNVIAKCLGDLAEVQMGYPFRSRLKPDPSGDVVVIQMKDIDDANRVHPETAVRLSLPGDNSRHLLRPGDLLFRSRGRNNKAALLDTEIGAAVLSAPMLLIRPHDVLPEYLRWFINAPSTQEKLAAMSTGTMLQMISTTALKALEVPVPPMATQQRIAAAATHADQEQELLARIATLRRRLATHQLMRSAYETAHD